ncbi:PREDICTED: reversion-inducing cysteine-rich protein with Kazal motifs-like [Nanorana parkeri]|uniref:reversion-inducing cysteine-rich protein with Kazal motifs-like n=1 Tax=Nanorana parkeri TaxID=125878 RepID=UPI000854BBB6|nr:PREDICTED: reversion-inducing cysteine-rich protein with Kazal motifs-like [Nanorana parkeri]
MRRDAQQPLMVPIAGRTLAFPCCPRHLSSPDEQTAAEEECVNTLGPATGLLLPNTVQAHYHGTSFKVDCNICSCVAGTVQCSNRQCLNELSSEDDRNMFTGLPCNCADKFVPVCGQNGRSYPSACIARCVGLLDHQFEFGLCSSKDPCNPNPCLKNQRCIIRRQVCLTSFEKFECRQYECMPRQIKCEHLRDPVCDSDNMEHPNICTLYQRGKQLSYKGSCQHFCKSVEPVCGHNGETYSNVCSAYYDRVAVDYYGRCQDVGIFSDHSFHTECSSVKCPLNPKSGCMPIIPPGACCPLCSGVLRILFDKEKLDAFAKIKKMPVTVMDVLEKIRPHISVPQCDVFGYLSVESELVVLVVPVDIHPKAIQIEACNKEAEKINSLINSDSPTIASQVPLSGLITSEVFISSTVNSDCTKNISDILCLYSCLLLNVLYMFYHL